MGRFTLVRKKERWTLTWPGRMVFILLVLFGVVLYAQTIHGFLAPIEPVNATVMVMEGFVPDYTVEEAFRIFRQENYELMLITGKKREKGSFLDFYENDGIFTAAILDSLGMDMTKVVVVEADEDITKDRTYYSAMKVKTWIEKNYPEISALNLLTIGCHGRRSHYLFQKACGDDIDIGIISLPNKSYLPGEWWKTSHGFRQVMQESIAWVYAKFFFFPAS